MAICVIRSAIILGFFQLVGTQQIPDQNTGAGTHATDDALHHAFYDTGNGIGGNGITAHVSQDDGVEDKGDAPDKGSTKDRCGIVPEILGQSAVSMQNASPADGNVATAPNCKISPNQFYHTGCDRGVSGADEPSRGAPRKPKIKMVLRQILITTAVDEILELSAACPVFFKRIK